MRDDAGIDPGSTVTLNVMKALLSMNQYKLVWKGSLKIQTIQRTLNKNYEDYIGLSPCDGLYGREMNKAMIMVLQAIEGYTPEEANGNFGSGTKSRLPMLFIPHVVNPEATYLFRSTLCCNGYDVELGYDWGNDVEIATFDFQSDMLLNTNGAADTDTWMALMISRGNIDRPSNGCDTRFEITPERGKLDALNSSKAARKFGMPKGTIIYFAVDTDPLDYQIEDFILPYFRALHENFDPDYKIGVYGTRNTCTQVCDNGYALTSFVSDMSYGFSGNMGFKIPKDWNLDQFYELSTSETGWDFDLDKTTYSGRFPVVDKIEHRNYIQPEIPQVEPETPLILSFIEDIRTLETLYKQHYDANLTPINGIPLLPNMLVIAMTNFLRSQEYNDWTWFFTTGSIIDSGFVSDIQENHSDIWEHMYNYIKENTEEFPRLDITDGETGLIDLSHFAATLEAYSGTGLPPSFWASWGGDLATGMSDTTINYKNRNEPGFEIYAGKTLQEIADATIGKSTLLCNYMDLCTDFDAYKISCCIAEEIKNSTAETLNFHLFSDALMWYYSSGQYRNRFVWFIEELGLETQTTLGALNAEIYESMNGIGEKAFLLPEKGNTPTQEVNAACCDSFANYIYKMINQ